MTQGNIHLHSRRAVGKPLAADGSFGTHIRTYAHSHIILRLCLPGVFAFFLKSVHSKDKTKALDHPRNLSMLGTSDR